MPDPRLGTMRAAELSSLFDEEDRPPDRPVDIVTLAATIMLEHAVGGPISDHAHLAANGVVTVVLVPDLEWRHPILKVWRELLRNNERPLEGCRRRDWVDTGTFAAFVPGDTPQSLDVREALEVFSRAVEQGQHCVAITPDVAWLPAQMIALADYTLTLGDLVASDLPGLIGTMDPGVTGISDAQCRRITPQLLRLAARPGRSSTDVIRRLEALLPPPIEAPSLPATPPVRDTPTLERLHGMREAVRWGQSLCADLVEYRAGRLSWADVDAGMLLSGPPGTGKTTFARALASSCSVALVSGSYGQWIGTGTGHQGDLVRSMRKTFAEARSKAPCILFVDEIDSFRNRSDLSEHNSEWNTQLLNSLLAEMDGVVGREGVVVIGACNDPSRLDAALVRAGRLDRHVAIGLPSEADLVLILREHLRGDLVDADLAGVASAMVGATGADVEQVVRDGRRLARAARTELKREHLVVAAFGADGRSPEEFWRSAVHEAGHAVLSHGQTRLTSVNIRLVRDAGGRTAQTPACMVPTEADLFAEIVVAMGGRAAEQLILGTLLPGSGGGAASDLGRATLMAARMVGAMGLDAKVGPLWLGDMNARTLPKALARSPVLHCRVRAMLDEAELQASEILGRNQPGLRAVAQALVRHRALSAEDVGSILNEQAGGPVHATRSGAPSSETRPERTDHEVHHVAG